MLAQVLRLRVRLKFEHFVNKRGWVAPTAATVCVGGQHRGRRGAKSRSASSEVLPQWEELGTPEFLCHRLQTSMTRATVEDGTAGLGQTFCKGTSSGSRVIRP